MQTLQTLTIADKNFLVAKTVTRHGWTFPWEVVSYIDDFDNAEVRGGFFDLSHWGTLEITGPDAQDFLQRMTTQDFREVTNSKIVFAAFLNGKAGIVSMGMFQKIENGFLMFLPPPLVAPTKEHIEKFHFQEKFEVKDVSQDWALFVFYQPTQELQKELEFSAVGVEPLKVEWRRWMSHNLEFWADNRREEFYWVKIKRRDSPAFFRETHRMKVALIGNRLFEFLRLKAGIPEVGNEITGQDIVLEANFEEAVARNKGCYPGQEVVERIYTYGSVNKKLLRLEMDRDEGVSFPKIPATLDGPSKEAIGVIQSYEEDPEDPQRAFGLGFVNKEYWKFEEDFYVGSGVVVRLAELHEITDY